MRVVFCWTALLLLPLFPLQANLGSTADEAQATYGKEQGDVTPVSGADSATQYSDNYRLYNVHFKDGKAVLIQIAGKRTPLNAANVSQLLKQHNNGQNWKRDPTNVNRWTNATNTAIAQFDPSRAELFLVATSWQTQQVTSPSPSSAPAPTDAKANEQRKGGTVIHRQPGK